MKKTYRILHFFCGMGGKGLGASHALARFGDHEATFETIGGIDFDAKACLDFEMLVGAPTLCIDVHKLEPDELRRFAGDRAPDVVMMSPPCKGFSGLLSAKRAAEAKYQLMNTLMERALFLLCATWPIPPKLVFVENVPRIASRGKTMIARCIAMGEAHGYAIAQGTHDCGELGNLAQHRRRYFQLWRHREQMPQVVYEPTKHRVRACGEVLGPLPMPGDVETAGPMHAVPRLSYRNWLRLAMIPAGGDWRDLPGTLEEGQKRREKFRRAPVTTWADPVETVTGPGGSAAAAVADPRVAQVLDLGENPARHKNKFGVRDWAQSVPTVTSTCNPGGGAISVADPRVVELLGLGCEPRAGAYGVQAFDEPAATVIGEHRIDAARAAVADPRFGNVDRVTDWSDPVGTITRSPAPSSGGGAVADPRWGGGRFGVGEWNEPIGTVAGESLPNNGKFSVADPRFAEGKKKNWQQVAGVTAWSSPAPTVTSGAKIHAGAFQVADPRTWVPSTRYRVMTLAEALALDLDPDKPPPWIPIIIAADGTWHRPLTTLELAVLQSFPWLFEGKPLVLAGKSHTRWREAIGNAVPPLAALAIGAQLLRALLIATLGAFTLDSNDIWVEPASEALVA